MIDTSKLPWRKYRVKQGNGDFVIDAAFKIHRMTRLTGSLTKIDDRDGNSVTVNLIDSFPAVQEKPKPGDWLVYRTDPISMLDVVSERLGRKLYTNKAAAIDASDVTWEPSDPGKVTLKGVILGTKGEACAIPLANKGTDLLANEHRIARMALVREIADATTWADIMICADALIRVRHQAEAMATERERHANSKRMD